MADFKKALEFVVSNEKIIKGKQYPKFVLCSNCFKDEGLRLDAFRIGIPNQKKCMNCKSTQGHKLNKKLVEDLCHQFFVRGSIHRTKYGGAPVIQFNNYHYKKSTIKASPLLNVDIKLIEEAIKIGLFHYGPNLWMVGEIEPLKALLDRKKRNKIVEKILTTYPSNELSKKDCFYRVRIDPKIPENPSEYDSPPLQHLGKNRLDDQAFPVLYGSADIQLCVHECRVSAEDNIYVAKMVPTRSLKLLDLTSIIQDGTTEFESLDLAIHFLFLAGKHAYKTCRIIAKKAKEHGFDGLIYPSYFSSLRTGGVPFESAYGISFRRIPEFKEYAQSQIALNVALFGWPVKEKKITVSCINKITINQVAYNLTFGPASI